MNELLFLLPALLACFILTGIHAYLGIHVISRGIIFLDIALAQVAALGLTIALLMEFHPETNIAYFFALGITFMAAVLFSFIRSEKYPMEAIIGITFVVCSAIGILIADRMPHCVEHLKYILSGNILWVSWEQIIKTAIIYTIIGLVLYRYHNKLLLTSIAYQETKRRGVNVRAWDLMFYIAFGLVITSSVQIAGILLVFSFLIIPALSSMIFYDTIKARLLAGWTFSIVASFVGIGFSYYLDLPTGPAIVTVMGFFLVLSFVVKRYVLH
ncbi:metal ABC transporter permease [bacterium]|nr:metal ABC transporter permease [bacterium]MBU1918169.1 metal ABC transporter permease [bacterium]